jgi:hypothetical protein
MNDRSNLILLATRAEILSIKIHIYVYLID